MGNRYKHSLIQDSLDNTAIVLHREHQASCSSPTIQDNVRTKRREKLPLKFISTHITDKTMPKGQCSKALGIRSSHNTFLFYLNKKILNLKQNYIQYEKVLSIVLKKERAIKKMELNPARTASSSKKYILNIQAIATW